MFIGSTTSYCWHVFSFETAIFHSVATFMIIAFIVIGSY